MAKKCNPAKLKKQRNAQFVAMIKRKKKENEELKKWKQRAERTALRIAMLPEKRHSQAVTAP